MSEVTVEAEARVEEAAAPKRSSRWRLVALAVFFVGSLILAKVTGISEQIDVETIRQLMESAGPLGGTFTCTQCQAQAWQPDLLVHAADCPYHPTAGRNRAPWRPA